VRTASGRAELGGLAELGLSPDDEWERLPAKLSHRDVAAVAVDDQDQVYLFTRHPSQVLVFRADGTFVRNFGEGLFAMAHGLEVDGEGCIYCVDNLDHTVRKFSPHGELLRTFGVQNQPSDTGFAPGAPFEIHSVEGVTHAGPPFNGCTDVAIGAGGDVYVSDGYGNCRIHHFDAAGELLDSWGEVGSGPGQFRLPHAITLTGDDRLLVADRENDRIQIFGLGGGYLGEWGGLQRPTDVAVADDGRVFVSELWRPVGNTGFVSDDRDEDLPSRMTVLDAGGRPIARWGASRTAKNALGNFIAPHGIALDRRGDLYVAEVTYTFALMPGWVPEDHARHQIQKFHHADQNTNQNTPDHKEST
jgi:sugar lactone lactonase YvrE